MEVEDIHLKAIVKSQVWKAFLGINQSLFKDPWDLIPQPVNILFEERIPYDSRILYHLEYEGISFIVWETDIEELII